MRKYWSTFLCYYLTKWDYFVVLLPKRVHKCYNQVDSNLWKLNRHYKLPEKICLLVAKTFSYEHLKSSRLLKRFAAGRSRMRQSHLSGSLIIWWLRMRYFRVIFTAEQSHSLAHNLTNNACLLSPTKILTISQLWLVDMASFQSQTAGLILCRVNCFANLRISSSRLHNWDVDHQVIFGQALILVCWCRCGEFKICFFSRLSLINQQCQTSCRQRRDLKTHIAMDKKVIFWLNNGKGSLLLQILKVSFFPTCAHCYRQSPFWNGAFLERGQKKYYWASIVWKSFYRAQPSFVIYFHSNTP